MKILFVCVANSIRSQMAEALAREIFGHRVDVRSAGSHPDRYIHPMTHKVLGEIHINTEGLKSKGLGDVEPEFIQDVDFIIPLCAEEVCPVLPGDAQRLDWPMPDPTAIAKGQDLTESFRKTRDLIKRKIETFNTALRRAEVAEEELT